MKASKIREMGQEDLKKEAEALSRQLFNLRVQSATGQLENVIKIRQVRRDLARVKTILTEKRTGST